MQHSPKLTIRNKFTRVKTAKSRKSSSKNWLQRQLNDPYVKQAQTDGYRSRAAYKLIEINHKYNILHKGTNILDLGAAPGSWSQVATNHKTNKVIAVDLLEVKPINGVYFVQGDFLSPDIQEKIRHILNEQQLDLILSDIAPNMIGHKDTDQLRIMAACETVLEFARDMLAPQGSMVVKIFQGIGFPEYISELKKIFKKVSTYKPEASRSSSAEIYIVAREYKTHKRNIK